MSGRVPRELIDDVLARVDIVDLIDSRVPLKKSGVNYVARCPFHSEKTPSFTVSREKQFYHCFGCGAHGSSIGFLMEYDHLRFMEAVEELAASVGIAIRAESAGSQGGVGSAELRNLYEAQEQVARFYAQQLRTHGEAGRAVNYLKMREVSGDIARRFGLGYAPPGWDHLASRFERETLLKLGLLIQKENGNAYDRFRDRIMFPIRDRRGRHVGFGGRVLDQSEPKYVNSPETPVFKKGREVYGLYELLGAASRPARILVVEGYLDVIALVQRGIAEVVATLGTATSREHIELLFRHTSELVFCFDGDAAGKAAAWRALEAALPALHDRRAVRFLLLPAGQDPDSLVRTEGAERFRQRLEAAAPLSDYLFKHLGEQLDLNTIEGRAGLVERAKSLIGKLPSGIYQDMLQERLAELARIDKVEMCGKAPVRGERGGFHPGERARFSAATIAAGLLLQHPRLAGHVDAAARWMCLEFPEEKLLVKLWGMISDNPRMTHGAITERFRGEAEEEHVSRLLQADLLVPEEGVEAEFLGALSRLEEKAVKARRRALLAKDPKTWTGAERDEWHQLLNASGEARQ